MRKVDGIEWPFFDYIAREVPFGPDDGTLAPWAVVASLPFAPEIVLPAVEHFIDQLQLKASNVYGFKSTFNATYPAIIGGSAKRDDGEIRRLAAIEALNVAIEKLKLSTLVAEGRFVSGVIRFLWMSLFQRYHWLKDKARQIG